MNNTFQKNNHSCRDSLKKSDWDPQFSSRARYNVHLPDASAAALLRIELTDLSEELQLPMVTFIYSILLIIWEKRLSRSRILLYDIRATLEAKCLLLRKTRLESMVPNLVEMMNYL